jgi:4,5:9,10-diseco-3-hydroxy-5,9,17-trioxoandrosta-1(10),2-diene-4-oate hydrolase
MSVPDEHYIKIGSIRTRYWMDGKGSPVILVHGMGGSATGWLTTFGPLCSQHKVYALDLIGHGRTDTPGPFLNPFSELTEFLCAFMSVLKIERAHIVGHSMGAAISALMTIKYPERVQRLVLADSAGLGREGAAFLRIMSIPGLGELLASMSYAPDVQKFGKTLRTSLVNANYVTDELIENLFAVEQNPTQSKTMLKILRSGADWRGQKRSFYEPIIHGLASVKQPTLLIWGKQDQLVPSQHGEQIVKLMPHARLELIDRCGHIPMFEQPKEFNNLLLKFLEDK